jgi:LuxR family maltose regulon positive regulatory protein
MLGFTELQRAEPTEAAHHAAAARESCTAETSPALRFALEVVQGAATYDSGDKMGGLSAMQHARSDLGDNHAAPLLLAAAALLEARAALQLGHLAAARTVRSWLADRISHCAELELLRAWIAEAEGHEPQAHALLRPLLENAQAALMPHTPVEAWLLEVGLCLSAGDRAAARQALSQALGLAKPIDTVRPFAMGRPGIRELLAAQQGSFGASNAFAARALGAATAIATNTAKALSERELTVLTMLPSMLSLVDIANDLTVSVNTVKSHVRSIYIKLGVGSRRAAVLAAHENGLLTIGR